MIEALLLLLIGTLVILAIIAANGYFVAQEFDRIEIELGGGQRIRITGRYDPEALARLLRGLTV